MRISDWSSRRVLFRSDADGRLVAEIARADLTRLKASGWVPPSVFTVKARDGSTDLYGQMFKPSDFDPAKQYPIVVNIYPGPQQGSIDSRSFRPTYDDNQALARSEEHTSELQSLMRISYAVFSLQKKTKKCR